MSAKRRSIARCSCNATSANACRLALYLCRAGANDLALSRSIRRPLPLRQFSECMCSNEIHRLGRGIQAHNRHFNRYLCPGNVCPKYGPTGSNRFTPCLPTTRKVTRPVNTRAFIRGVTVCAVRTSRPRFKSNIHGSPSIVRIRVRYCSRPPHGSKSLPYERRRLISHSWCTGDRAPRLPAMARTDSTKRFEVF
jgi:hypothetical protein